MTVVYKQRRGKFYKVEDGVKTSISEEEWLKAHGLLEDEDAGTLQEEAEEEKAYEAPTKEKWSLLKKQTREKLESGEADWENLTKEEWDSLDLPVAD